MGQPRAGRPRERRVNQIARRGHTRGSETSQYPEERKTTVIPRVAASESGPAQTRGLAPGGCGTETWYSNGQGNGLERPAAGGESPVPEARTRPICIPSTTGHVKPRRNLGGPPPKAKHYAMTDSELVPRGKGEKNPGEGSETDLKPCARIAAGAGREAGDRMPFA